MDISNCNANNPNNFNNNNVSALPYVVRAVSETAKGSDKSNCPIPKLADGYSERNYAPITKALQHFTADLGDDFHGHAYSCIDYSDVDSVFSSKNNMFKSKEGKQVVKDSAYISQADIFSQFIAQDGGLRYATEKDNIGKAARNYAAADINAIEKSHNIAIGKNKIDGKLTADEVRSANRSQYDSFASLLGKLNLDDTTGSIDDKEYASYIIALDSIKLNEQTGQYEFDINNADGLLTQEEAQRGIDMCLPLLKEYAKQVYNKYFAGLFNKV